MARAYCVFSPPASHFEQDFVLAGGERVQVKWDELTKLQQLGRGAYGTVDLMLHQPTKTKMAVKVGGTSI